MKTLDDILKKLIEHWGKPRGAFPSKSQEKRIITEIIAQAKADILALLPTDRELENIVDNKRCKGCYGYPETPLEEIVEAITAEYRKRLGGE